jgi:site-specific DNA recombinase
MLPSSSGWRLPGQEIEQVIGHAALEILLDDVAITAALQESGIAAHHIPSALNAAGKIQPDAADLVDRFIKRVELRQDGIRLTLSLASLVAPEMDSTAVTIYRDISLQMKRRGAEMRLIIGGARPARVDQALLRTMVRANKWFNDLVSGRVNNFAEIASQEGIDKSYVSRVMNLAFLAPDIIESILAGRQPADLNVEKLTKRIDLPLDWAQQRQLLGFV